MTLVPCAAVRAPPPQVPLWPLGVAISRPAGNVSLKAIPVRVVAALLFWMVNVREVELLRKMLAAPNVLEITGGSATVMLALEVLPVPPSLEAT